MAKMTVCKRYVAYKVVPILDRPGLSDISHLVDFSALARCAEAQGARLIGPVEQGRFLA